MGHQLSSSYSCLGSLHKQMNLQCKSFRSLLEKGRGGGGVAPRPLKGVAVVGKIRFGVELVFSIVIVSEIPLLSSPIIIGWRQKKFWFF